MINIDPNITVQEFRPLLKEFWKISGDKILLIEKEYDNKKGSPVFTSNGKYTTRGWTEWTEGFRYGSSFLQFDATNDSNFLDIGKKYTLEKMASHLTHTGVHDHGFNNISTYGNWLRLMNEGKIEFEEGEKNFNELALKISGAVQATRWTNTSEGGYIYSFNGPHSLFVDTVRSCRSLVVSHLLGHFLFSENDCRINLMDRALEHLLTTAKYSVFYGEGEDIYDEWGRTAHESIFNINDGNFRCYNSQQGYSGHTTWTRGLAWAMCGFAEELELFQEMEIEQFSGFGSKKKVLEIVEKAAVATCDFYIRNMPADGIPYWDCGAPGLTKLEDYKNVAANPYNDFEPVDSSAAAIGAQGLLRLGRYLKNKGENKQGEKYRKAGLTVLKRLLGPVYINKDDDHQGLLLHALYHRPKDWDFYSGIAKIPNGNSCMWGDYHIREVALLIEKEIKNEPYYSFFEGLK